MVAVFFALLVSAIKLGAQPCVIPITPDDIFVEQKFGTAYNLPIGVQSVEIKSGPEQTELEGFYLTVEAFALGVEYPRDVAHAKGYPPITPQPRENWFRRNTEERLQYLVFGNIDCQSAPDLWQSKRSKVKITWEEKEKLLHELEGEETFGSFSILSSAAMNKNDILSLRSFFLQPSRPGHFRIEMNLYALNRKQQPLPKPEQTRQVHVYFSCPDYQPALSFLGGDTIQLQEVKYNIHLPIVNNVFFEEGEAPRFTANSTDSLFRAMLFGRAVERLACAAHDSLRLLILPDPLYATDRWGYYKIKPTLMLSEARARFLQQELEGLAHAFYGGQKCGALSNGSAVNTCLLKFRYEEHRDGPLFEAYIKPHKSAKEPKKFREENRVVPIETRNSHDEALLFAPLSIKPKEYPRHVQVKLWAANTSPEMELMPQCLDAGWITVHSIARGDSSQPLSLNDEQLKRLRTDSVTVVLDELEKFFSQPGLYVAQFALRSFCSETTVYSERDTFYVKGQAILLDEIFALSPYDNATFKYDYDARRVPEIINELFDEAEAMSKQQAIAEEPIEAQLYISGHTDTLAEHKGPYYNLGLSFRRAQAARDSLLSHFLRIGRERKFLPLEAQKSFEECYVSSDMQQKMRSLPHAKPVTQAFFKSLNSSAKRSESLQKFYQLLKDDRMRHFRLPPETQNLAPPSLDSLGVAQEIVGVENDIAQSLLQATLQKGPTRLRVHFIAAGLGDKIPFYRRTQMTTEFNRLLCAGDYEDFQPKQVIYEIYANDQHPAGRVMNRRIEVSLIFDKNPTLQLPMVKK